MSVCPSCQQMDKNFFAERCHHCNEYISFWEQVGHSLLWTLVPPIFWICFYLLMIKIFLVGF